MTLFQMGFITLSAVIILFIALDRLREARAQKVKGVGWRAFTFSGSLLFVVLIVSFVVQSVLFGPVVCKISPKDFLHEKAVVGISKRSREAPGSFLAFLSNNRMKLRLFDDLESIEDIEREYDILILDRESGPKDSIMVNRLLRFVRYGGGIVYCVGAVSKKDCSLFENAFAIDFKDGMVIRDYANNSVLLAALSGQGDSLLMRDCACFDIGRNNSVQCTVKPSIPCSEDWYIDLDGDCRQDDGERRAEGKYLAASIEIGTNKGNLFVIGSKYPFYSQNGSVVNQKQVYSILDSVSPIPAAEVKISLLNAPSPVDFGDNLRIHVKTVNKNRIPAKTITVVCDIPGEFCVPDSLKWKAYPAINKYYWYETIRNPFSSDTSCAKISLTRRFDIRYTRFFQESYDLSLWGYSIIWDRIISASKRCTISCCGICKEIQFPHMR